MHKSANQPGYNVDLGQARQEALKLASTDAPVVPNGLADVLDLAAPGGAPFLGVDKAATPAERSSNVGDLGRELD
eukprot:753139-Pyramimonas_sp.AAC.1